MINILIADDHHIVRSGLKHYISSIPDIEVAGEASTGEETLIKVKQRDYDIIVLDITMPDMNGLEVLKQLKNLNPKLKVLVLTMHPEEQYASQAIKAGASGYLTKGVEPKELVEAIRRIASGGRYISNAVAEKLASDLEPSSSHALYQILSQREYQIMSMIVMGKRLKDIANELDLSIKTVSSYRSRILLKLNLENNAEMVRYAMNNDLILKWRF
jgi:two-component system, NarL family, invasion response regulator UvrY